MNNDNPKPITANTPGNGAPMAYHPAPPPPPPRPPTRKQRRAARAIARSAKYKEEQKRKALSEARTKLREMTRGIAAEEHREKAPASGPVAEYYERKSAREEAAELAPMGSALEQMAANIRAKKSAP